MADQPLNDDPVSGSRATFWLWLILGGGFLVLFAWLLRFPWGGP